MSIHEIYVGDTSLAELPECQKGMQLILSLCLSEGFDTLPTLLCADGCCMIDRRMGVYRYPIEIQALFFMALRCVMFLLKHDAPGKELIERIVKRLHALSYHIKSYFWLDLKHLNDIYRYKTEEYSHISVNKFNVMPNSLLERVFDFMPLHGGYFIGNIWAIASPSFRPLQHMNNQLPLWISLSQDAKSWLEICQSKFVTPLSKITSGESLPDAIQKIQDGATAMVDHR